VKSICARLTLLSFLLPLTTAGDESRPPPPETGVTTTHTAQRKVVEVVLPGRLLDTNLPHLPLILLVATNSPDGAEPRSLLQFDAAGGGHLEVLASGLSEHIESIHTLAGHKGRDEILLGEPGTIHRFNTALSTLEPLLTARHLNLGLSQRFSTGADLLVPRVGRLESWGWKDTGQLIQKHSLELPVRVERQRGGLRLFTPPLNPLRGSDAARLVLGPVPQGKQRLHSAILDLASEEIGLESWALLPTPERVEDRWYILIDEQPVLVVTTTNSQKLGIFEKKKLRVFPLRDDRTRSGRAPSLAIETPTRRWFSPGIEALDWDDDGDDDLAIIAPDGLGGKKLVISIYPGKGNGAFILRARKTVVTAPQASWHYGADLDGDHRPDLVTSDENGLRIFAGVAASHKKSVVEKTPRATWTLQQLATSPGVRRFLAARKKKDDDLQLGRPWVVDLDGDGRNEVLAQARLVEMTVLWWVALQESEP